MQYLPTSPAWIRDSSSFVWIHLSPVLILSPLSWDIASVSFVCHGSLSYGFTDMGFYGIKRSS